MHFFALRALKTWAFVIKFLYDFNLYFARKSVCHQQLTFIVWANKAEGGMLNRNLYLDPSLGVTKFKYVRDIILFTLYCATFVRLRCSTNPPLLPIRFKLKPRK
jgi:hypothetical protein